MVNVGPLTAEIGLPVWGTPAYFNRFRVLACSVTTRHSSNGGVEQRTSSVFGRAAITFGTGPHSSLEYFVDIKPIMNV